MSLSDLRVVNAQGGIQATKTATGGDMYIEPGTILHDLAMAGTLGPVAPYVAPAPPEARPVYADAPAALAGLVAALEGFAAPLVSGTPLEERLTWGIKEAAARAVIAGTASDAERMTIEGEAAISGEDSADLAQIILDKAALYRRVSAALAGLRRKATAEIAAATDPHAFEGIIAAAVAQARAAVVAMGYGPAFGIADPAA